MFFCYVIIDCLERHIERKHLLLICYTKTMKKISQFIITGIIAMTLFTGVSVSAQSTQAQIKATLQMQIRNIIMQLIEQLQDQLNQQAGEKNENISESQEEEFDITKTDRYPQQRSDNVETSVTTQSVSGDDNDYLEYRVDFDINAFGNDAYIQESAINAIDFSIAKDGAVVYDSNGTVQNGAVVVSLSSDANLRNGEYRIDEDNSETFSLAVSYSPFSGTPAGAGAYRLQVDGVNYTLVPGGAIQTYNTSNLTKFRTNYGTIID